MSYTQQNGTYVPSEDVTLAPSSARTANGTGTYVEMGRNSTLRLALVVSAASGTNPTLDVRVETSRDGSTWRTHDTFSQVTAGGTVRKSFGGLDRFARAAWTVGGTNPSFTFSLTGEAI